MTGHFYVREGHSGHAPSERLSTYRVPEPQDITDDMIDRAIETVEEMVTLAQIEGGRPAEDRYLMRCALEAVICS